MEQGKRKLSETVLEHCTDVRLLFERLCDETKLEFAIVCCGVFTHSLCKCQPNASSPEPSAYILQNGGGRKTFPLFVCLSAEAHHNLQKVWPTRKLQELPSFIRVADLNAIKLTTGIGTHDSGAHSFGVI